MARTTKAAENEETFVTASPSVHVKASRHIFKAGRARPLCVQRKLQMNHNFLNKFVGKDAKNPTNNRKSSSK